MLSGPMMLPAEIDTDGGMSAGELRKELVSRRVRPSSVNRRIFGGSTDPQLIASVISSAEQGNMAEIADLISETMLLDLHMSSCAHKRFGPVAAADWDVTPAQAVDKADRKWAIDIADGVRDIIERIDPRDADELTAWAESDGRAAHEVKWAAGAWGYKFAPYALEWVHPRDLSYGCHRELIYVDPTHTWGGFSSDRGTPVEETPGKFLFSKPRLFREHHEREGIGPRSLFWSFFKRFGWRMMMKLIECWGLPWRIITIDGKDGGLVASPESIERIRDEIEDLSGEGTATMDQGVDLRVEWPGENSGALFKMNLESVNAEMSKMWNGSVGTGDLEANRANGIIGKGEQDVIFQRTCHRVDRSWVPLVRQIVRQNWGAGAVHLVPKRQIRAQPQRDRDKELARVRVFLGLGMTVAVDEVRETAGFRAPIDDEKFLRLAPSGGVDAMGNALPGAVEVVDPSADAARVDAGDVEIQKPTINITPTDIAMVVTVNEARASAGLAPLDGPDGLLTLPEFKAKHAAVISEGADAAAGTASPTGSDTTIDAPKRQPGPPAASAGTLEDGGVDGLRDNAAAAVVKDALGLARGYAASAICCDQQAGKTIPASAVYGSPEVLVERGVREGTRASSAWVAALAAAVDGHGDAVSIRRALDGVRLDVEAMARAVEKRLVHGAMLGALDADWEAENDRVVKPPAFSITNGREVEESEPLRLARYGIDPQPLMLAGGVVNFVESPFAEAIRIFKQRNVVTRRAFDRLQAQAKQRAFTVADMASKDVIGLVKSDLVKALEEGDDLRRFSARLKERAELAGWVAENPSHVENVFRTNTMGAYSRGREEQMTQPSVLAARPYRQLLGVKDSRTRKFHAAAHGKVLRHDDAAVARLRTPLGFCCRCRWVSRSAADVERLGLQVVSGASFQGLPDEGWDGPGGF